LTLPGPGRTRSLLGTLDDQRPGEQVFGLKESCQHSFDSADKVWVWGMTSLVLP
jgi:hypothetical protein